MEVLSSSLVAGTMLHLSLNMPIYVGLCNSNTWQTRMNLPKFHIFLDFGLFKKMHLSLNFSLNGVHSLTNSTLYHIFQAIFQPQGPTVATPGHQQGMCCYKLQLQSTVTSYCYKLL